MILNFRVSNYRSFREDTSISFLATRLDPHAGLGVQIAESGPPTKVLPVVAILGANASGKSNLLRAIAFMRDEVLYSATRPPFEQQPRDYFKLDPACREEPTLMEIDFALRGSRYQYGFELRDNLVTGEWLNIFPHKRTQTLFDREGQEFQFGKNLAGPNRRLTEVTRQNVLLLSVGAQAGHPLLSEIYEWFLVNLQFLDVPARSSSADVFAARLRQQRKRASQLLHMADLGVIDTQIERIQTDPEHVESVRFMVRNALREREASEREMEEYVQSILREEQSETVTLLHRGVSGVIPLPFEDESVGTKAWLTFISFALSVLDVGGTLLVDELDASLHPLLLREAMRLFQDHRSNQRSAQMIFTTHDTSVLSAEDPELKLSRGQFWFAEKTSTGNSTLTPLTDFRPRKNENLERGYLQGRYGGAPRIDEIDRAAAHNA